MTIFDIFSKFFYFLFNCIEYIKFTNDNHDNHDKGFMQLSCEEISLLMIAEANAISALAEKLPKS